MKNEINQDIKTLLVVVLLVIMYPAGVVLMWLWMKWPVWVKIVLMVPMALPIAFLIGVFWVLGFWVSRGGESRLYSECTVKCNQLRQEAKEKGREVNKYCYRDCVRGGIDEQGNRLEGNL